MWSLHDMKIKPWNGEKSENRFDSETMKINWKLSIEDMLVSLWPALEDNSTTSGKISHSDW